MALHKNRYSKILQQLQITIKCVIEDKSGKKKRMWGDVKTIVVMIIIFIMIVRPLQLSLLLHHHFYFHIACNPINVFCILYSYTIY